MSDSVQGSIIVPVLNEADQIVQRLQHVRTLMNRQWKLIVVDGGSHDATCVLATPWCDELLQSAPGRSQQMNKGAQAALGDVLVFLHVDTLLPRDFEQQMQQFLHSGKRWGRFDVVLDSDHPVLKLVTFMMNLRSRLTGIATGDQAFFVHRTFFEKLQGFADIPLMEDVEFSRRACRVERPFCSRARVITSARKWQRNGIFRTIVLMWWIRLAYFVGVSPITLHRWYYPQQ